MLPKKKGVIVKNGQVWSIGKKTKDMLNTKENKVYIIETIVGDGLITVQTLDTGLKYDVKIQNLGKLVH